MQSNKKDISLEKKVLFSFVVIILFFVSLESAARIIDYIKNRHYVADFPDVIYDTHPYIPIILKPNTAFRPRNININSLGYRGKDFKIIKTPGTFRIVCIGGSTVFGIGSSSDKTTFPQLLEDVLNKKISGKKFEVINAGVPGYTTAESLIDIELRLLDLSPDLIFIYHGYNDFKPNRMPNFKSDYSHWRYREPIYIGRPFLDNFRFYTKLRNLILKYLPKNQDSSFPELKRFDTVSIEGVKAFERNLKSMIDIAKSRNIKVILSTFVIPLNDTNLKKNPEMFKALLYFTPTLTYQGVLDARTKYNNAAKELAEEENIPLVDFDKIMPQSLEYFDDYVHFNDIGAMFIGENIANSIIENYFKEK
ncbi:MAG: SGNH/GDSL hydrolase family protein [Candidatus Schekmanbacteria bacterium]|nr:SGNH/GDSL hydrolase family protein [Candidatus Schekmanbacteria bacterium]